MVVCDIEGGGRGVVFRSIEDGAKSVVVFGAEDGGSTDESGFVHKLEDVGRQGGKGIFGTNRDGATGFVDDGHAERSAELALKFPL